MREKAIFLNRLLLCIFGHAAKGDIHHNANRRRSHNQYLLQHLPYKFSHSRLGMFIRTKHSICSVWTCQSSGRGPQKTRPSITRISGAVEWSSRQWLQCHFQVIGRLPRKSEKTNGRWVWAMFFCRSPWFFLLQAFPCQEPAFCPFFLQSHVAVSGMASLYVTSYRGCIIKFPAYTPLYIQIIP